MAEIDSLEIKITSEAGTAEKAIDSLAQSLGKLATSLKIDTSSLEKLGNINGTGLKNLGIGVKTLASGLKDLQGIEKSDFDRLAKGVERLAAIQPGNMEAVGNALRPLAQGINILSTAKFENSGLENLINSLARLANANTSSLVGVDFTAIGNSIKGLTDALSGAAGVERNTISMTNSIAKLANAGEKAYIVTSALPQLGEKLKEFFQIMSTAARLESDTIAFTQALAQLANAGKKAETTANSLKKLGDELLTFFQTMSGAPNVSENTIRMTQALSGLTNAGGRTGNAVRELGNTARGTGNVIRELGSAARGVGNAVRGLGNNFSSGSISSNKFSASITKLSKSIQGLGNGLKKPFKGIKSFTKQLLSAAGITLGLYGAVRGAKKSMDTFSDLIEVQNVVNVTFGKMAYKVEDFAQTSIEQFGMSELALKQYSSRFQAMGAAMGIKPSLIKNANENLEKMTGGYVSASDSMADMSLNLTKLTADMASFYNVEQDVVAEKLAAVFTGQTRPLRDFGLDLTQATLSEWALKNGLDADIQSMSQAEKTMLRYQYVLANTTAAQNDFARTADTWANQTRILKQNLEQLASVIGGVLVNAFKPLVKAANEAMATIIAFAKTVSNALGKIFGWTFEEGSGGIAQDFAGAAEGAEDMADETDEAKKNLEEMQKGLRAFDELKTISIDEDKKKEEEAEEDTGIGDKDWNIGEWKENENLLKKFDSEIDNLHDLGKYIGKALLDALNSIDWDAVYQAARNFGKGLADFLNGLISPELFYALGKTIAGALNTALHFLDSFGQTFNWANFGDSLAAGLLGFLENIQWDVALSAAKNWGEGLATTLNHFISPKTFGATGRAIAMALNTAIQFALSFGDTLKFVNIGESIAAALNNFFSTFNFVGLARTLNIWAKGILDAIIAALDNTNWRMIGEQIGRFLEEIDFIEIGKKFGKAIWKAINAGVDIFKGMFSVAPIETAILSLIVMPKLLKAITSTKFVRGIKNLWGNFKTWSEKLRTTNRNLAENRGETSETSTLLQRLGEKLGNVKVAFSNFFSDAKNDGFWKTLNGRITDLRNNLTGVQKGAIVAVAGFAEFSVISNSVEKITLGTGDMLTEIGKIAGVAAVAAGAMYTALGPAGLAIAAITGVVAAIKGINDAFDTIRAQEIGESIKSAMSNPGGVAIEDLANGISEAFSNAASGFSELNTKSSELTTVNGNIKNVVDEIDRIKRAMDLGVESVEGGKERINTALGSLVELTNQKMNILTTTLLNLYGEGGALSHAYGETEYSAEQVTDAIIRAQYATDEAAQSIYEQMQNVEFGSTEWYNLYIQLQNNARGMEDFEKAAFTFSDNVNKAADGINWDKLMGVDGKLNETYLKEILENVSTSLDEYTKVLNESEQQTKLYWNEMLTKAATPEDKAIFQSELENVEKQFEGMRIAAQGQVTQFTSTLQSDYIEKTAQVISEADKKWTGALGQGKEGTFIKEAVDTHYAEFEKLQSAITGSFSELQETGVAEARSTMEAMYGALFSEDYSGSFWRDLLNPDYLLNEGWESTIGAASNSLKRAVGLETKVISDSFIENMKEEIPGWAAYSEEGLAKAIEEQVPDISKTGDLIGDTLDKGARGRLGIKSPSTVFAEIGMYTVLGFNKGIEKNTGTTISVIGKYANTITDTFSKIVQMMNQIGIQAMSGLMDGLSSMEFSIYAKADEIANNVANTIKKALDIHSPSRVMFKLGDYTMQGFKEGMESLYNPITDSIKAFSYDVSIAPAPSFSDMYGEYVNPTIEYTPQYNGADIYRESRRTADMISELRQQNQLLREQNRLLDAIYRKPTMEIGDLNTALAKDSMYRGGNVRGGSMSRLAVAEELYT